MTEAHAPADSAWAALAAQAGTLWDRLDGRLLPEEGPEDESLIEARLLTWCKTAAEERWDDFTKRLAWEGLDLASARRVLGAARLADPLCLPAWVDTLRAALATPDPCPANDRAISPGTAVAFEEAFLPFVRAGRKRLTRRAAEDYQLLSGPAHASLERNLLRWISRLSAKPLELEFSLFRASRQSTYERLDQSRAGPPSRRHYDDFLAYLFDGGLLDFFREYAVLARLVSTGVDLWVEGTGDLIAQLGADLPEIRRLFAGGVDPGAVVAIQSSLSDSHHGGRSVKVLTFESGLKLVYKPKDVGIERTYFDLLAWLNQRGAEPSFQLIATLDRPTYGWVEFVPATPCTHESEVQRYYERAGMLLSIAHLLGATDLHAENIIANGEHPVLIDLETLLHPELQETGLHDGSESAQDLAGQRLQYSVLRTGLLPRWQFLLRTHGHDYTGLGGGRTAKTVTQRPVWSSVNTDRMALEYRFLDVRPTQNVPAVGGARVELAGYHEPIIRGFTRMYRILMAHRAELQAPSGPLAAFAHREVRFISRTTNTYALALLRAGNPDYLRHGVDRSIQLDILSRRILGKSPERLDDIPFLKPERAALERMDIPYFVARTDSRDLALAPDCTLPGYFIEPSFSSVVARLDQMNEQDLEWQIEIIRGSLFSRSAASPHREAPSNRHAQAAHPPVGPLSDAQAIESALAIGSLLADRAVRGPDGSATWIGPLYVPEARQYQVEPIGHSLYDGVCGIALFLGVLAKVTGEGRFGELARAAVQGFKEKMPGGSSSHPKHETRIGGAVGWGSVVYGLTRLAQVLEERELLDSACRAAEQITRDRIAEDRQFDVVYGAAGAVLGLVSLYQHTGSEAVLEQARSCGLHLLENRMPTEAGFRAWATLDGKPLTGFSHGAAGIAFALLRLCRASGDTGFLSAAAEAIRYERSVFLPELGDWPDFRFAHPSANRMCSWCHGAPGIGLARAGGLGVLDTAEIRQDLDIAIETTILQGLTEIDQLCCGNAGRMELLLVAGKLLGRPDLIATARQHAAWIVRRGREGGYDLHSGRGGFHPGLFQGLSGIGYQLLRVAEPELTPSVLLWE